MIKIDQVTNIEAILKAMKTVDPMEDLVPDLGIEIVKARVVLNLFPNPALKKGKPI